MRGDIALEVEKLKKQLWNRRDEVCPDWHLPSDLLKPQIAARLLGYKYKEETINDWPPESRTGVAGFVDPLREIIVISPKFGPEVALFTGAHEIGHILLHKPVKQLRERPIWGPRIGVRNVMELEADTFAALFLMPEKLVREAFKSIFYLEPPIRLEENLAIKLCPDNPGELLDGERGFSLALRRAAAWSTPFSRRLSLSQRFGVSVQAMAIRLNELKFLIK